MPDDMFGSLTDVFWNAKGSSQAKPKEKKPGLTFNEFSHAISRVSFGHPLSQLRPVLKRPEEVGPRIYITLETPDRETGVMSFLHSQKYVSFTEQFKTDLDVFKAVRRQLIEALTHEIDECLKVDGKLIFDPHDYATRIEP